MPAEPVLGVYRFGPGGLIFVHNFENEGIMVVLIGSRYKNHRPKKTSAVKLGAGLEPFFFFFCIFTLKPWGSNGSSNYDDCAG